MNITLEQIDMVRKEAKANYSEAREALQMHDGDVSAAINYLKASRRENNNNRRETVNEPGVVPYEAKKQKGSSIFSELKTTIENLIRKGFELRVLVSKESRLRLDISLNLFLLSLLIAFPFTVGATILAFLTKHRIVLKSKFRDEVSVHYSDIKFNTSHDDSY